MFNIIIHLINSSCVFSFPMFQTDSCKKFLCFTILSFPPATPFLFLCFGILCSKCALRQQPSPHTRVQAAVALSVHGGSPSPLQPHVLHGVAHHAQQQRSPCTAEAAITSHQALHWGRVLPPPYHEAVLRPPILSVRLCRAVENTRCFCFDLRVNHFLVYSCESIN